MGSSGAAALGFLGILVSVLMYGTMYVPVKKYKTYDGMLFQWYTSSGTVLVGVLVGIMFDWGDDDGVTVPWEGIVGGIIYSCVQVTFPLTVKLTGLALGFVLWSGFSIVFGWAISRFGLWGLDPSAATYPALDWIAIITCIFALIMMMFIKPDSVSVEPIKPSEKSSNKSKKEKKLLQYERILANAEDSKDGTADNNANNNNATDEKSGDMWPTPSHERNSKNFRRRRLSMEIAQSSSLIPTAYLFGTWLDFDQLAKDRYFERKLRRKYNDDTIGIVPNSIVGYRDSISMTPRSSSSLSYGATGGNNDVKHTASVNMKVLATHSKDESDTDADESDVLVEQYREMRTNYQWLKPLIQGQCQCGPQGRRIFGLFLGIMEGILAAHSYVPYLYWQQKHETELDDNELYILNYVFSYTIGIYLGSTFFFCVMGIYKKCNKLFWPKPVVRPAFSCGCMYSLGYAGFLFSTAYITYPVCYISVLVGSIVLSNLTSLFYFKEITNRKSIRLLSGSMTLMTIAIIMEAISG